MNPPNFSKSIEDREFFIYATFLPPGYHQMLIYDPESRRAFCKDIIVGMNHKDFYPEYPILQDPVKHTKVVQNVEKHRRGSVVVFGSDTNVGIGLPQFLVSGVAVLLGPGSGYVRSRERS